MNLFLYRVAPNTGWANQRLPARSSAGERTANPYLALDLHYVLSAFSTEDLNAEVLLGFGMQTLHELPVFDRAAIRAALGAGGPVSGAILPSAFQALSPTALADQLEQVKVTPYNMSSDEASKLWTAFNTPLRMSAFYQVTVVLIESASSTRATLPVLTRELFVRQLQRPAITRLLSQGPADPAPLASRHIVHGDTLVVEGSGLRGDVTIVAIGEAEIAPIEVGDRQLRVVIPDTLRPGVTGVQVIHRIAKRPPSVEQMPGETSGVAAFVLHPSLAAVNGIEVVLATLEDAGDPAGPVHVRIRLTFAHGVGASQRTELLLSEHAPPATRRAFSFTVLAEPLPVPPPLLVTSREFVCRQVPQGTYLVRGRVDGAETRLDVVGGVFGAPTVEIAP